MKFLPSAKNEGATRANPDNEDEKFYRALCGLIGTMHLCALPSAGCNNCAIILLARQVYFCFLQPLSKLVVSTACNLALTS